MIDIQRILSEISILPDNEAQISLQVSIDGQNGTGKLTTLQGRESDYDILAYDIPYTNSVITDLGMYRSRVMRMKPKTCYSYHRDATQRVHIPLVTNDKCFFVIDDEIKRCPADGSHYLIDTRKLHTFVNASREERIHIIGCVDANT